MMLGFVSHQKRINPVALLLVIEASHSAQQSKHASRQNSRIGGGGCSLTHRRSIHTNLGLLRLPDILWYVTSDSIVVTARDLARCFLW
jgi:hypothetical protein